MKELIIRTVATAGRNVERREDMIVDIREPGVFAIFDRIEIDSAKIESVVKEDGMGGRIDRIERLFVLGGLSSRPLDRSRRSGFRWRSSGPYLWLVKGRSNPQSQRTNTKWLLFARERDCAYS